MNIAILNNENANKIVNALKAIHNESGMGLHIHICHSAMELLTTAAGIELDIVVLAEKFKKETMDGYDVAYRIKMINKQTMPVIVTRNCKIDIKAGKSELFGYISIDDIETALPGLIKYAAKRHPQVAKAELVYHWKGTEKTADISKILYFYSTARVVNYKSAEEESGAFYQRLDEVERLLLGNGVKFVRIGKSFLANPQYILKRERQEVVMKNGDRLPISRKYQRV